MPSLIRQRQIANWIALWTVIFFLTLALLFSGVNSASAASQEITLYNHWTAGWAFDFSRGEAFSFWDHYDDDSYSMDLCFIGQPEEMKFESFYEEGLGIYDAGEVALGAMTEPDSSLLSDKVPVVLNHSYWISTVDGEYYKLRVTDIDLSLDANSNATSITFEFEVSGGSSPIVPGPSTYTDWPAQVITDPYHNWTVEFNSNVEASTVNYNSVYVSDSGGQNLYLNTSVVGRTVSVISSGYEPGDYYLYIEDTVESESATALNQAVRMPFTVTDAGASTAIGLVMDNNYQGLTGVNIQVLSNGSLLDQTTTLDGNYSLELEPGQYTVVFSQDGYLSVEQTVSVDGSGTVYLETVYLQSEDSTENGSISGQVRNAADGSGVPYLNIYFRSGVNVTTGEIMDTTTTDYEGNFSVTNLAPGYYTGEISGSGYTTSYFTVNCLAGLDNYQDATITQSLNEGEIRIVLSWGETPWDLDSHLGGPTESGGSFHVYYANMQDDWDNPAVILDVDDTSSYGPETVTIYRQLSGTYTYSVHDYTNGSGYGYNDEGSGEAGEQTLQTARNVTEPKLPAKSGDTSLQLCEYSSGSLATSGAQVKVYRGNSLIRTFNVPNNQQGVWWKVFELSGNTITPINEISYQSPYADDPINEATCLYGYVYDDSDYTAIPDAYIEVYDQYGNWVDSVYSDSSGYYSLNELQPGCYDVYVSKDGYESSTNNIYIYNGSNWQYFYLSETGSQGAVLSGYIYDNYENFTISNVLVDVYDETGNWVCQTFSDYNGYYNITDLQAGDYELTLYKDGYQSQSLALYLDNGENCHEMFMVPSE